MALELLAGPFPLTHGDHAGYLVKAENSERSSFWLDGHGLILSTMAQSPQGYPYWETMIGQMDGTVYVRNNDRNRNGSTHLMYDAQRQSLLTVGVDGRGIRLFDPLTCRFTSTVNSWFSTTPWTRLKDRYIYAGRSGGKQAILSTALTGTGSATGETLLSRAGANQPRGVLSPGRWPMFYAAYPNGDIYGYNVETQTETGPWMSIGLSNIGIWYSVEHDLFISLHKVIADGAHNHDEIRIWAHETRPATVSTPVALTPITQGQVSQVQVQVLGDMGEPVAGRLVDWSLTGSGALATTQSSTDASGLAEITYVAPVLTTGSADITATVTY